MSLPYDARTATLAVPAQAQAPTSEFATSKLATSKLATVQYLRAAAALAVAVMHAAGYIDHFRDDPTYYRVFGPAFGAFGVAVFFAISGYLMARAIDTAEPSRFLLHRVARIYPAFLLVVVLQQLLAPAVTRPHIDWVALTLVPSGERGYPVGVEWTLLFEMTFYVGLFAIAVAGLSRHLERIAVAWLGLILVASFMLPESKMTLAKPELWQLLMQPPNVAFAGGLLVPALLRKRLLPPASVCIVALIAGMVAYTSVSDVAGRWISGLVAPLVVGAAVRRDKTGPATAPIGPLLALGDWSYALYLVHAPILYAFMKVLPASVPNGAIFAAGVATSLAAATAVGTFDVSFYRRIKRRIDAFSPSRCRWLAAAFVVFFAGIAIYFPSARMWKEWQDAAAMKVLSALPPEAFRSEAAAIAATAAVGTAPRNFAGELERIDATKGGHLFVSGWALDKDRPAGTVFMAVYCQGRQIILAKRMRLRADVAAELGRPDLRKERIGFAIATEEPQACAPADLVVFAVDLKGWAAVVPGVQAAAAPR